MANTLMISNKRDKVKALIRAQAMDEGVKSIGMRAMNEKEWMRSAVSAEARAAAEKEALRAVSGARVGHAAIDESAVGGSGYGEHLKRKRTDAANNAMQSALHALSRAYGDYYSDRQLRSSETETATRVNVMSHMVASELPMEDAVLYALAAGMPFEQAYNMARDALRLRDSYADLYDAIMIGTDQ